jgi:hydroxyacylglutathione hydrolase
MFLKQYYLGCLAHASYLIGDEVSGVAAVVDPQRDVDEYLADAESNGLTIKHVLLTHYHADFLAGHLELRNRVGAKIYVGARGSDEAEYEHVAMADESTIDLGAVRIEALETPGHSPESITYLVFDPANSDESPYAALTGDTLFIGDVGRPDLQGALGWTMQQLGELLYDSIRKLLKRIPDETLIYPAHGAGSLCGKNLSKETVSTMGVQKQYNYALRPMSQQTFVDIVTADQPDAPAYFTYDAILNRKEHQTLDTTLQESLTPLPLSEVLRIQTDGGQILDARDPVEWESAHLVGTTNIGLGGEYATWVGTLLDSALPIVIIADTGRVEEAATRLGRIGFDNIAGYLDGGMSALANRPDVLASTQRIAPRTVIEQMDGQQVTFVDVRTPREWEAGHIEGSVNIPLNRLPEMLDDVPRGEDNLVIHCGSGYRSAIAASVLEKSGITGFYDLAGGMDAWKASEA